jgi:lysophospholipase L1-like esterase
MTYISLSRARIFCDGNSITSGDAIPGYTTGLGYPEQLAYQLNMLNYTVKVSNLGVSGQTTIAMSIDAVSQIDNSFEIGDTNIIIAWEGGNDIYFGATPLRAYENFRDYCISRRSRGFYVVAIDTLPRSNGYPAGSLNSDGSAKTKAQYDADILEFNRLVRLNWREFSDSYINIRKELPHFTTSDTRWLYDGIHPSFEGNSIIAAKIVSYLRTIRKRRF